jgi:ketol-acid reductoisomerase
MASVMTKKRLAIIGSGNIVKFHVPAMRRAGFDVVSCCSSYKSSAAVEFAKQYDIPTVNDSYKDLIDNEKEPDKLDKDIIRDWVKNNCDPYLESIPIIPTTIIKKVEEVYNNYNNIFS